MSFFGQRAARAATKDPSGASSHAGDVSTLNGANLRQCPTQVRVEPIFCPGEFWSKKDGVFFVPWKGKSRIGTFRPLEYFFVIFCRSRSFYQSHGPTCGRVNFFTLLHPYMHLMRIGTDAHRCFIPSIPDGWTAEPTLRCTTMHQ